MLARWGDEAGGDGLNGACVAGDCAASGRVRQSRTASRVGFRRGMLWANSTTNGMKKRHRVGLGNGFELGFGVASEGAASWQRVGAKRLLRVGFRDKSLTERKMPWEAI